MFVALIGRAQARAGAQEAATQTFRKAIALAKALPAVQKDNYLRVIAGLQAEAGDVAEALLHLHPIDEARAHVALEDVEAMHVGERQRDERSALRGERVAWPVPWLASSLGDRFLFLIHVRLPFLRRSFSVGGAEQPVSNCSDGDRQQRPWLHE